ncbi:3-dehydroquinate synthase [Streptomyces europaeiscabiei]|uniref:3-dehydroquinate synthase n=1 Tax=Streptomyces europaeiscabiei TaxID=146819 RepID=UPI0029B83659|nr:3-dehydroquinate synthase family protein [Streptomyces europaeiscabiei]MDX3866855.1 3-dehydroquinate synthase [Streptomyces europaeiscabiei]MDX3873117.1 3-dehydroquinate synthase [Streptomyces europaeiscabiei]
MLDQGQAFTVRSYRGAYDVRSISLKRALPTGLSASDRLVVDATVLAEHPEVGTLACSAPALPVVAEEDLKSLEGALLVVTWLLDSGFDRGGTLYVIGGGTVQDTAAFAASIVHRGARWVFVPTTLLAQGDSCIGSKSSINHRGYKNQLGTFHPPAEVIVDDAFLGTLAPREVQSGIGEMLHYAALGGGTVWAAFEAELSGGWERLSTADMSALAMRAMTVKKDFVEADEFDTGLRRNLNFGHTFGHGIEYASRGHIPHGIAVAYGMECANAYAEKLCILAPEVRARIGLIVRGLVDGSELREVSASQIVNGMAQDKKRVGDEAELILLEDLGRPVRVSARLDGHLERFLEHVLDTW